MVGQQYYSVPEAARELGVTAGRVRQLICRGQMSGERLGSFWAISRAEIDRYNQHRRKPGGQSKNGGPPV